MRRRFIHFALECVCEHILDGPRRRREGGGDYWEGIGGERHPGVGTLSSQHLSFSTIVQLGR